MENQDKYHAIAQILALRALGVHNQENLSQKLFKAGIITNSFDFTEWGQRLANLILIEQNERKFRTFLKQIEGFEQDIVKRHKENEK